MKQCNQMGPHGKCTRSWKRRFGVTKTNCTQFGLTHVFNVPEQAPNMPHTDKDEDKDEDGDLTMEDRMTTRSNSQTTGTSPVGSATDMVRDPSRHNDYQQMYEDGMAYWNGMNFKERDKKHGQSMIEASASSGYPMAVAYCHYQGWNGMEEDDKKALAMYVKIEQETNGYHWAQFMLGRATAMNNLAVCWKNGHGCAQDYTKAVEWYTKASAQGNSSAMNNLAVCWMNGHGCAQDYTKAVEWYTKASAQGNSSAMFNLGVCWMNGRGCDQNQTTAFEWFQKSAQLGDKDAQDILNSAALSANGNEQSNSDDELL